MNKPAICGGTPVRDTKLYYGHQYIDDADIQAVVDVLESDYLTLVKSVFGSGNLSDNKYITPMVNAGKANSISPVLIASRIRIEVGENGSKSTSGESFTWKGKTYSGYYNFFNIGAYETTINGVKY